MAMTKRERLLKKLSQGSPYDAIEAAKLLLKLKPLSPQPIIDALKEIKVDRNREAAIYALSWLRCREKKAVLQVLLDVANDENEYPSVRGQALEGIGVQAPTKRSPLWEEIERAILKGLEDQAVEVRFWACYAAGVLRIKSALPKLRELAESDSEVYPRWWRVSEEASDAIEWIYKRATEPRLPMASRVENREDA